MIDQQERNTWVYLTSPFIVMEFCAAYRFINGSQSKVSFETEVSQHRSGQSIPLGNVCSGHVQCHDTILRTIEQYRFHAVESKHSSLSAPSTLMSCLTSTTDIIYAVFRIYEYPHKPLTLCVFSKCFKFAVRQPSMNKKKVGNATSLLRKQH